MRLIVGSLSLLLLFSSLTAQISVPQDTVQKLLTVGNPIRIYGSTGAESSVDVGLKGANRVYDFSSVGFVLINVDTVRQVSSIPYLASRFPAEAFALTFSDEEDEKNHGLLIFQGNELNTPGDYEEYNADSLKVTHNNPFELFLKFPVTYGDSIARTSTITDSLFVRGSLDSTEAHVIPTYYVVDGWGTLKLPGGEEHPCLRLRWYEELPDGTPPDYHYMSFRYITNNGIILHIETTNDQPIEGQVRLDGTVLQFRNSQATVVSVSKDDNSPTEFSLSHNYPNPFNPATTISFSLATKSLVSLRIFDILGREVAVLISDILPAGTHSSQWNAERVSSGVYFYRLQAGTFSETKKLLLIR